MSGLRTEIAKLKNFGHSGKVWNTWAMIHRRSLLATLDLVEEASTIQNSNSSDLENCEMTHTVLEEIAQIPRLDTPAPFVLEATAQPSFARPGLRECCHYSAVPRTGAALNSFQKQERNRQN